MPSNAAAVTDEIGIGHNGGPTLNPVLEDFWRARVNDNHEPIRNRILYGGRASSKSWDAAGFAVFLASTHRVKILCARQFQNKIEESVYTLIVAQIERFGLRDQFRILDNKIIHKRTRSEFLFYGLWRHISEIKSLEGVDICWIEEAHNLTQVQWEILNPTLRKEGSQFWIIFNPMLSTDFVWRRFVAKPPAGTIVRKINYLENPFLSRTMLDLIADAKSEDEDDYEHIYLGVPRDDDDDAVIKRSWLMAAVDAHKALGIEPTGSSRLGFDVADQGVDLCALVHARGSLVTWSDLWKAKEDELLKSCTRAWNAAKDRDAQIIYDSIGVGAMAGAKFNELNSARHDTPQIMHRKFNAGGAVYRPESIYSLQTKNKDMFANIKAQAWWLVADRLKNTFNAVKNGHKFSDDDMIFIDSNTPMLDKLIDELATPKRDTDNAGRVKVESKKDLDKREVPSPNLADAFVMAFAPGLAPMVISDDVLRQI